MKNDVFDYIDNCRDPWGLKAIGKNPEIVGMLRRDIGKIGKVLDIGGGYGFYADALRLMGNDVTVIDKSKKMIRVVKNEIAYCSTLDIDFNGIDLMVL